LRTHRMPLPARPAGLGPQHLCRPLQYLKAAHALRGLLNGVARNSHDAVCETTASLPNNFRISKYGCQTGAPRRPWSRALSQRMKPTSAGASASATSGCTNSATYRLIWTTTRRRAPRRAPRRHRAGTGGESPPAIGGSGSPAPAHLVLRGHRRPSRTRERRGSCM